MYQQFPVHGYRAGTETVRDKIVLFEVLTDDLGRAWWRNDRGQLEKLFQQDELMMRAQEIERL